MEITVPPVPDDKDSASWRKYLTGVDPSKQKGYRALGTFLEPGDLVDVPEGGLVLAVDRALRGWRDEFVPGRHVPGPARVPQKDATVTVYLAADGELVELWSRHYIDGKSAFGATTTKKLTALLDKHPVPPGTPLVVREARRPNRKDGRCRWCDGPVRAETGHLVGHGADAVVEHYENCPPKDVPSAEQHVCVLCGVEVVPSQALLHLVRDGSGLWEARHKVLDWRGRTCLEEPVPSPQEQQAAREKKLRLERERRERERVEQQRQEEKKRQAAARRARQKREAHDREQARVAGLATVKRESTTLFDKSLGDGRRARLLEHLDTLEDATTTKRWTVQTYFQGSLTPNAYGDYDPDTIDTTQDFTDKTQARGHYQEFKYQEVRWSPSAAPRGPRGAGGHGTCAECGNRAGVVPRTDSSGIEGWVCERCDRDNPDDVMLSFS